MSIQEINRKHIMYGLIAMLILTFMCGCSGVEAQSTGENTACDNPTLEQRLATLQRNAEVSGYNSGYSLGILEAEWFEGELKFIQ